VRGRALITGSAGFVGGYLTTHLNELGYDVHGLDLRVNGDVRDYETVHTAVETVEPDVIFHLAAMAYVPESTTAPYRALDVNVGGTLNVLEAVRNTGSQARVLISGTSEEYGYDHVVVNEDTPTRPTTAYGVTKLAAGLLGLTYARDYGLDVVVTRAFNHTGPGHSPRYAVPSFAKRVAEVEAGLRSVVYHGNLETVRSYTDVRDVVRAYAAAVHLPGGVYNVCSGDKTSVLPVGAVLGKLCALAKTEIPCEQSTRLTRSSGASRFPHAWPTKLHELTGWVAEIPLEKTLQDTLDYWRERV